jgi:predicted sulfurtransferase
MKRNISLQTVLLMASILVIAALAVSCASAPSLRPVKNLSLEQFKKIFDSGAAVTVVDTRTEYEFRKGHIPGAVNIPPEKFDVIGSLLPGDKNAHIVFYCRGSA